MGYTPRTGMSSPGADGRGRDMEVIKSYALDDETATRLGNALDDLEIENTVTLAGVDEEGPYGATIEIFGKDFGFYIMQDS